MAWRSYSIKMLLAVTMVLPPVTASAAPPLVVPGLGSFSISRLTQAGVSSMKQVRNASGEAVYQFLDDSGNILRSFVVGKTKPSELAEFKPSRLREYFSHLRQNSGSIAVHKIKTFPFEAFTFFVAIGAITTADLVFNYNSNPVAMDQFLAQQKDPVGQMGFAAFMVANGLTSEPLMAVAQSRGARYFIPYLGMSVGMIASNIVHEIGHFPGLKECAVGMGRRAVQKAGQAVAGGELADMKDCDKAFEAWSKMSLSEKGHEWAPGLFSMVASTAMAGGIEAALNGSVAMAARMSSAVALRMVAIEMLITVAPGGIVVRGARWTYKIAQLAGFIYLDTVLRAPMVFTWKNAVQLGPQLRDSDQRIGILARRKLSNGWNPETALNAAGRPVCADEKSTNCYNDLDRELLEMQKIMTKWREANMESVLMAHANWSQYLHQLTSQYRVSKQFYFDFVSDLWKKRYELPENYVALMDRPMPLYGVTPKGLDQDEREKFLLQPNKVLNMQMETIADVVQTLQESPADLSALRPEEQKVYNDIVTGLSSAEPNKIGAALQTLRYYLWKDPIQHLAPTTLKLKALLEPIFDKLGDPQPLMAPGQGYLKLVAKDPNNPIYANNPFSGGNSLFLTPTVPEYLAIQMIKGPDVEKGESTVSNNMAGFPASFAAPRIRIDGSLRSQRMPEIPELGFDLNQSLFRMRFWVQRDGQNIGGGTLFDFLRNEGGVRAEIVGDQTGHKIAQWWEQYPERQLTNAFLNYETKYEDIIQDLHQKLFRTDSSFINRGPVANGVLKSMAQERAIYLYIVDSFLNSQAGRPSPAPMDDTGYSVLTTSGQIVNSKNEWTQAMLAKWTELEALLRKLEAKPVRSGNATKNYIVSRVSNEDLQKVAAAMEEQLKQIPLDMEKLTEFQKKVLAAALQGLNASGQELLNFGQIINNVSYVENFVGGSGEPMRRRCLSTPAARGTQQWLAGQYQGCPGQN